MAVETRGERGAYLIPLVLHDANSTISIKGVIINLSATGCRVLTNDRRLRITDPKRIVGKIFLLDFDFHDLETGGIEGKIMNVKPGPLPKFDRTVGIQFTTIDPLVKRDLNRIVMRDKARGTA